MTEIIPAILTNDLSDFRKQYAELLSLAHNFSKLHIDFIDGEFLPAPTVMPDELNFLKTNLELMAHLMTINPNQYFAQLKKLNFTWALIQFETFPNDWELIEAINLGKQIGLKIGLVINPETPLHKTAKALTQVQLVQIMGVHPGAQGREMKKGTLEKIKELRSLSANVIISVDGGIHEGLAKQCKDAGADWIIVGSAVSHASNPKLALENFVNEVK